MHNKPISTYPQSEISGISNSLNAFQSVSSCRCCFWSPARGYSRQTGSRSLRVIPLLVLISDLSPSSIRSVTAAPLNPRPALRRGQHLHSLLERRHHLVLLDQGVVRRTPSLDALEDRLADFGREAPIQHLLALY